MEEHTCPLPARMDNAVSLESEYGANKWGFMRKERGSVRKTITVETAYKVYVCPRGNLLYCRPYFISNLIISVNISFLLKPPAYPHGKSLFTSHFELNS